MKTLPISLKAYQRQQRLFGKPLCELTTTELLAATKDCLRVTARSVIKSAQAVKDMTPFRIDILS